jgi:predicted Ser/Thr protein kinase
MPTMVSGGSRSTGEAYYGAPSGRDGDGGLPRADRGATIADMDARQQLAGIGDGVRTLYAEQRSILSFQEYLDLFEREPRAQARSSAQWLRDVFDHFGSEEEHGPAGPVRRYRLFDLEFAPEWRSQRVIGQEEVQSAIYRILGNFVRSGRVNKLILLHGPNGSAKSTIVSAIARAMEAYSRKAEGALYRFTWVFPSERKLRGGGTVGFGSGTGTGELDSYAHLEGDALDARLACPMKDHPLFLVPRPERRRLLERACRPADGDRAGAQDFVLSEHVANGELCQFCQPIYAALLATHRGDWLKVLRHVQVERFYVSSRYQHGVVAVEPQVMVADAQFRQITADRTLVSLPPALHALSLAEPFGPLVYANRGLLEYADLLKRDPPLWKYLLGLSETGRVSVAGFLLDLDAVLIASANEQQLSMFRENPALEFQSFKGRLELVRVPYLRRASVERRIYEGQVTAATVGRHVAPHATEVAAMWAVLTRLEKPRADRYPESVRDVVDDLTPLEKLRLYDSGEPPAGLATPKARELKKHLETLYRETEALKSYEGKIGASAREMKTALMNAAQSARFRCLTPIAVLEEIEALCKERAVHDFLQQEPVDGYHDAEKLARDVQGHLLDVLDEEIREAMGLVSEGQYRDLFGRYITQVSSWVKGERIRNRVTGEYERPDDARMEEIEAIVMPEREDHGAFRRGLIATIGAYRLDHPGDTELDFALVFPDLFRRLREHAYDERKRQLRLAKENMLRWLSDERSQLDERVRRDVERALATLQGRHGYCEHCAEDAVRYLLHERYD